MPPCIRKRSFDVRLRGLGVALALGLLACAEASSPGSRRCASSDECGGGTCLGGTCVPAEDLGPADADEEEAGAQDPGISTDISPLTDVPGAPDVPECGEALTACERNDDCCSDYCIDTDDGRLCTELCAEDEHCSGEGWTCRLLAGSGPDATRLCVPPQDILCQPCTNDIDCSSLSDFCMDQDDGRFCATNCTESRSCPEGFFCNPHDLVIDGEETVVRLCEPATGRCSTECEPGFGDCDGLRGNGCETDIWDAAACGTTCDERETCVDDDACTEDLCSDGTCENPPICAGSATSCGCASCTDCSAGDGWYDVGDPYACCDGSSTCLTCQDQEYRTNGCDGTSCSYEVTATQTLKSECSACADTDACTADVCADAVCTNPAFCDGSDTSCGCETCADCTASDGWYPIGTPYACCDGGFQCMCQDEELRGYTCDGTGCTFAVEDQRSVRSGCSACSDGAACTQDTCLDGACSYPAYCSGTATSCGCTTCIDCTANDGWFNVGAPFACCDGLSSCSSCQSQEYRTHSCGGTDCSYTVTATQTLRNGCNTCGDGNACTQDLCGGAGICSNAAFCAGTDTSCGCDSCTSCTASNGWYNVGAAYACCDGSASCSSCQDQELRSYSCSGTGCVYAVVGSQTLRNGCSACDDGNACTQSFCSAGSCSHPAFCAGTATSCGCSSCTNCSLNNGWYNVGSAYACCDGGARCSTCQDQQFRTYSCSGTDCTFAVTNTQTLRSGCATCNDGNSCTNDFCSAGSCSHPSFCSGTTGSCGCSSCSNCGTLPNVSSGSCAGTSCTINACSGGFAHCDGNVANGCERQNSGYSNSAPGEPLGSFGGDTFTGFPLCSGTSCSLVQTRTGTRGRWFNVSANENSDCCAYVAMTYELFVPPDADFDLHVTGSCSCVRWDWATNSWFLGCSGINGTGLSEHIVAWCDDDCFGANDGFNSNVEVSHWSGSTCGEWVLQVSNRDCYP